MTYSDAVKECSIVEIWWEDHCVFTEAGWRPVDSELTPMIIKSVGYVIRNAKKYFEIADSLVVDEATSSNHRVILKSCIKHIKVLHGTKKI